MLQIILKRQKLCIIGNNKINNYYSKILLRSIAITFMITYTNAAYCDDVAPVDGVCPDFYCMRTTTIDYAYDGTTRYAGMCTPVDSDLSGNQQKTIDGYCNNPVCDRELARSDPWLSYNNWRPYMNPEIEENMEWEKLYATPVIYKSDYTNFDNGNGLHPWGGNGELLEVPVATYSWQCISQCAQEPTCTWAFPRSSQDGASWGRRARNYGCMLWYGDGAPSNLALKYDWYVTAWHKKTILGVTSATVSCYPGEFNNAGVCEPCPAGTFELEGTCTDCPTFTASIANSSSIDACLCLAGYSFNIDASTCQYPVGGAGVYCGDVTYFSSSNFFLCMNLDEVNSALAASGLNSITPGITCNEAGTEYDFNDVGSCYFPPSWTLRSSDPSYIYNAEGTSNNFFSKIFYTTTLSTSENWENCANANMCSLRIGHMGGSHWNKILPGDQIFFSETSMPCDGTCGACAAGKYKANAGNGVCETCPSNMVPVNGDGNTGSEYCICDIGAYYASANTCELCHVGTYKDSYGNTSCSECSGDSSKSTLSSGATGLIDCLCIAGYGVDSYDQNGIAVCSPCAQGTFKSLLDNSACQWCPVGSTTLYTQSLSQASCISKPGYYGLDGADTFTPCPWNSYKGDAGGETEADCISCFPGSMTTEQAATAKTDCQCLLQGYEYFDGNQCACQAGYYDSNPDPASSTCVLCEAGKYCPKDCSLYGSDQFCLAKLDCPEYSTSSPSSTSLAQCACIAGYIDTGSCVACEVGKYKESAQVCGSCPNHTTTAGVGSASIDSCVCASGYTVLDSNASSSSRRLLSHGSCENLPPGPPPYYCLPGWEDNCVDETEWLAGFPPFTNFDNGDGCISCTDFLSVNPSVDCDTLFDDLGQTSTAQIECTACEEGKYKDFIGNEACVSCPALKTSDAGAADVVECNCIAGHYREEISGNCSLCPVNQYGIDNICWDCPENMDTQGNVGAGAISDCSCSAGFYGVVGACSVCEAGNYCAGGESQTACPEFRSSFAGAGGVQDCFCASPYVEDSGSCVLCSAGKYRNDEGIALLPFLPEAIEVVFAPDQYDDNANTWYWTQSQTQHADLLSLLFPEFSSISEWPSCSASAVVPGSTSGDLFTNYPCVVNAGDHSGSPERQCNSNSGQILDHRGHWKGQMSKCPAYLFKYEIRDKDTQTIQTRTFRVSQTSWIWWWYIAVFNEGVAIYHYNVQLNTVLDSGDYFVRNSAEVCKQCPSHSESLEGSTLPTDCTCQDGHVGPPGGPCLPLLPCPPGSFGVDSVDLSSCQLCPENTYKMLSGDSECLECGVNLVSPPGTALAQHCSCISGYLSVPQPGEFPANGAEIYCNQMDSCVFGCISAPYYYNRADEAGLYFCLNQEEGLAMMSAAGYPDDLVDYGPDTWAQIDKNVLTQDMWLLKADGLKVQLRKEFFIARMGHIPLRFGAGHSWWHMWMDCDYDSGKWYNSPCQDGPICPQSDKCDWLVNWGQSYYNWAEQEAYHYFGNGVFYEEEYHMQKYIFHVGDRIYASEPTGLVYPPPKCELCPANTYLINNTCAPCPNDLESDVGSLDVNECECRKQGHFQANMACEPCPNNTFYENGACEQCPVNSISAAASISIDNCICLPGFIDNGFECVGCDAGQYLEETICVACPEHSWSVKNSASLSSCLCAAGYQANFANTPPTCDSCPVGTFKNSSSSESCTPCQEFSTSAIGATSQLNCTCFEGYKNILGRECGKICPAGYEHHEANVACYPCNNNHYKEMAGDHLCEACPVNSFHSKYNSTSLNDCLCARGFVRHASWPAVKECVPCAAGSFNMEPGSEKCFECFNESVTHEVVSEDPSAWTYNGPYTSLPAYLNDFNQAWCHNSPSYATVDLGTFKYTYGLFLRGWKERGYTSIAKRFAFFYWYAPSDDLLPSNEDMANNNFHYAVSSGIYTISDFENSACEVTGCWKRLTTARSEGHITMNSAETSWPTYLSAEFGNDCDIHNQCYEYTILFSEHSFIAFDKIRTRYWRAWIQQGTYNNNKCLTWGSIFQSSKCEKSVAANALECAGMCNYIEGYKTTDTGVQQCGFNHFNNGTQKECFTCSEGSSHLKLGASNENECECHAGYYRPVAGVGACEKCPVNTFKEGAGDTPCTSCPPNSLSAAGSTSQSSCLCRAGFGAVDGLCVACDDGFFKAETANTACAPCALNTISFDGKTVCKCKKGFAAHADNFDCVACPAGQYKDVIGAYACSNCMANSTSQQGSTSIQNCTCSYGYALEEALEEHNNACVLLCSPGYVYSESSSRCAICDSGSFSAHGTACEQCALPMTRSPPGAMSNADCYCAEGEIGLRYRSYVVVKEVGTPKNTHAREGRGDLYPPWRVKKTALLKSLELHNVSPFHRIFVYAHSQGERLLVFSCDVTTCSESNIQITLNDMAAELEIIAPASVRWTLTSYVGLEILQISRWKCFDDACERMTINQSENEMLFAAEDSPGLWQAMEEHCLGLCAVGSLLFIEDNPSGRDVCEPCGPGLICE